MTEDKTVNNLTITDLIYNQDNFRNVPDLSVDFILTDPPFNIAQETNFHTYEKNTIHSYQFDSEAEEKWDTYTHEEFKEEMKRWSVEFNRVLKKGGSFAIFCADVYVSHFIEALKEAGLAPRRVVSWTKPNAVPINRAYGLTSAVEYIIVGVKKGKTTFNGDIPLENQKLDSRLIESVLVAEKVSSVMNSQIRQAVLDAAITEGTDRDHIDRIVEIVKATITEQTPHAVDRVKNMYKVNAEDKKYLQACVPNHVSMPLKTGNRVHPTEKPTLLLKYFLALYSKQGDKVLDPFAGSGSCGEACLEMGRVPILIEREKEFYEKAKERLGKFI